jgi:peptide/nickel transport system substrate-binding protein
MDQTNSERGQAAGMSRRRLLQLGAAGTLALPGLSGLLAACGDDDDTQGSTNTTPQGTGTGPSTTAATVPADRTAILKFGQMRGESYDPIRSVAVEYVQLHCIFDTLLGISREDSTLQPRLATEWSVTGNRLRLKLRSGVVFQDNTPFNADAVKFSMERVMNEASSNTKTRLANVASIEVIDPSTVEIVMKTPAPGPLLLQLTDRPGMIVSPTAVRAAGSSDAFSKKPVGAGMYKLEGDWRPRESMSVRAWDGYWDKDAVKLAGIDFTEIAFAAKVNALRSGAVDVIGFEGADVAVLKGDSNLRVLVGPGPAMRGLWINTTIAPFDKELVRQAISHAIDRNAVVAAMTQGQGEPRHQPFGKDSQAYDTALENRWPYDVDKAKSLLTQAGFPNGLTFQSIIGGTATTYVQFGEVIQGQLKRANINMDLQLVDQARAIPMLFRDGNRGVAASAPIGGGATSANTDQFIRDGFLREGATNAGGVEVPGVRDLIDRAAAATNENDAKALYKQANKIITDGLWQNIAIYADAAVTGFQKHVGGITKAFVDTDINSNILRGVFISQGKVAVSK